MKYADRDVMRLREIAEEIRMKKRGVAHAIGESGRIIEAAELAFLHSTHNIRSKTKQNVQYFDTEMDPIKKPFVPKFVKPSKATIRRAAIVLGDIGNKRRKQRN